MGTNPIHRLSVNLVGDPGGIPNQMNDIEALLLFLFEHPQPVQHDILFGSVADLHRQLRSIRDRLNNVESQPLAVADQLTTLDQRMTDIENATGNMPNLTDLTGVHNRMKRQHDRITEVDGRYETLSEQIGNIEKHCEALEAERQIIRNDVAFLANYLGFSYAKGRNFAKDRFQRVPGEPADWFITGGEGESRPKSQPDHEPLFRMKTDQCGVVCLERWREGLVLWHHGSIVWRSWTA